MPIYEYQCRKCGALSEVFQKMDAKPPAKCGKCGGRLERRISAPAIQFKGSGWYVTDYANNGKRAAEKAESDAAKVDKKSDKKKESSPAKKTSEKASTTKSPSKD
ncbi:MAG TPA: zinc ribbon domain-containing protein [Pyrinomonadaceae bacterium]|nr:zinc ribbon domain-containing protein [Pyrinomonadaceae bacterium]